LIEKEIGEPHPGLGRKLGQGLKQRMGGDHPIAQEPHGKTLIAIGHRSGRERIGLRALAKARIKRAARPDRTTACPADETAHRTTNGAANRATHETCALKAPDRTAHGPANRTPHRTSNWTALESFGHPAGERIMPRDFSGFDQVTQIG
jgi:hypothetical protein